MAKSYHIRDLEEVTGIKAHTIRMWEKRYNLIEPERSETNIRYYDEATFKKFLLITRLYYSDVKISEISRLTIDEIQEKVLLLHPTEVNFESWSSDLLLTVIKFDNFLFEKTLKDSIFSFNLDRTIYDFIIPFVHKIDTLWKTEAISIIHKKFAFENIKRFFYNISYSITTNYPKGENKIILITDDEELNTFALLYADIVLRRKNYEIIFLNNISDLDHFFEYFETFETNKILAMSSISPEKQSTLMKFVKKMPKTTFYIIDLKFSLDEEHNNMILINNLEELDSEI
ncbi:MAG: MerR family transcriptional regulator [Bacteroidales bacterium]|nr:MerR family transcriptional regulator [Bacteroidales bacterium]